MIDNTELSEQNTVDISFRSINKQLWMNGMEDFCYRILKELGKRKTELSILFCKDDFIKQLNIKYRSIKSATDVLAFNQENDNGFVRQTPLPLYDGERKQYLGDIVISVDTLLKNALTFKVEPGEELKRLIIHGILHLIGMDHEKPESGMIKLQEKLLERIK